MKPNYKNWVPKIFIFGMAAATALSIAALIVFGICGLWVTGSWRIILGIVFAVATLGCGKALQWSITAYRAFSYNGKRQLSRKITQGTAKYITLPVSGVGLDVGCGSGGLTIACAKRNPQGLMVGVDRWARIMRNSAYRFARAMRKRKVSATRSFKKATLPSNVIKLRKEPSSEMSLALFFTKKSKNF